MFHGIEQCGGLLLNYSISSRRPDLGKKRKELVISLIIISCPNLDLSLVCEWFSQKNNNEAQSGRRSNGFHTTTPVFAPCTRYHYGQDHRLKKSLVFCLFFEKIWRRSCTYLGPIFFTKLKIENGLFTSFSLSLAEMIDRKIEHKKSFFVLEIRRLSEPVDFTSIVHTWWVYANVAKNRHIYLVPREWTWHRLHVNWVWE